MFPQPCDSFGDSPGPVLFRWILHGSSFPCIVFPMRKDGICMKLFLFRKRYLAIPGAILAICALCLLTTLPSYVTTAATQRQLPIYCVQRDHKVVSLSFDAA